MIKCSNASCESRWWHTECAGIKGVTAAACKKIVFVCPCCAIKKFSDKFELQHPKSIDAEELKMEIKQGIAECLPEMVKEVIKSVHTDSDSLKNNMKKTFAEVMQEQQNEKHQPITKDLIKEAMTEGKKEQQKLDERKKNIMVLNAQESL